MKNKVLIFILARVFKIRVKINDLDIRRWIMSSSYSLPVDPSEITNVKIFQKGKRYEVIIQSHRPGLIIGKKGSLFDALKVYLNDISPYPLDLKIKEDRLWVNLYGKKSK